MPKYPIVFSGGTYVDQTTNNVVSAKISINSYPSVNDRGEAILRSAHGYRSNVPYTNGFREVITADGRIFAISISAGHLYELDNVGGEIDRGNLVIGSDSRPRMATNGLTIVIVTDADDTADYSFDLSTNTLSSLTVDPIYAGFGKAVDVTYFNQYYVFVTKSAIFHGSVKSTGKGIVFNALSFAELPFETSEGMGVEGSLGQIYVFSRVEAVTYRQTGAVPFAFQLNLGQSIDIGLTYPTNKVAIKDFIFIDGYDGKGSRAAFVISGLSATKISNRDYIMRDKSVKESYVKGVVLDDGITLYFRDDQAGMNAVYKFDESKRQNRNIWYYIGYESFEIPSGDRRWDFPNYNILPFTFVAVSGSSYNEVREPAFLCSPQSGSGFKSNYDKDYTSVKVFINDSPDVNDIFVYTFDYESNSSEAVLFKKVRMRQIDPEMTTELLFTDGNDGGIMDPVISSSFKPDEFYSSYGELVTQTGLVEFRRLGRAMDRRAFMVVLREPDTSITNTKSGGIANGIIEI